jgi:hypothetical protein
MVLALMLAYMDEPGSWLLGLGTNAFTTVSGYEIDAATGRTTQFFG